MLDSYITITGSEQVERLFLEAPKWTNQTLNQAFARAGGYFFKQFCRGYRVGGITVHRRYVSKKGKALREKRQTGSSRYKVAVPKGAKLAGFKGEVQGIRWIQGKRLRIATRNPVMIAHEFGATIRPKTKKGLRIRIKTREQAQRTSQPGHKLPFFIVVRQVKIPARLGFYRTWAQTTPALQDRIAKAINRLISRINARGWASRFAGGEAEVA